MSVVGTVEYRRLPVAIRAFLYRHTLLISSIVPPVGSVAPLGWVLVVGALAAVVGTAGLIWYLSRYRAAPGANWFIAALGAQGLWIVAYTGGLFITGRFWRASAEAVMWVGVAWLGPLFLAFALAYTGRSNIVRTRWFLFVFGAPVVTTVIAGTHPLHALLWQEFRLAPLFGLATVQYVIQPWGYVAAIVSLTTAGAGVLLLVETVVSYGPLYRTEAIAVTLSTLPPAGAFVVWLLGLSPWPSLNLAAVMFLPHVLLDAYAFVGSHMFETNPTTQRAAERGALSDLDDPLLVVDPDERVVNMNARAREVFDATEMALPASVTALVGVPLKALRDGGEFEAEQTDEVYAVSHTPLTDPGGAAVGGLLVFYDITTVRHQEQRLSVLNRVLRHNLRNRLTVTQGYAEMIESEATDQSIREYATVIQTANEQLLSIGQRIRDFQRVQDRELTISTVDPVAVAERLTARVTEDYPAARLDVVADIDDRRLETDEEIVELALRNLLDNAVIHSETADPVATIRVAAASARRVVFEIRDQNDRIPETEIETLDADEESALQHSQGIGLWIVTWCLEYVDGDLSFTYDGGNTVTVTLPQGDPAQELHR